MFENAEVIYSYTREDALNDGVLVDVTKTANEAGFNCPVAITKALFERIALIPTKHSYQSYSGRLWDVLFMAMMRIKASKERGSVLIYKVILFTDHREDQEEEENPTKLKLVAGPGDVGELVITIMLPEED